MGTTKETCGVITTLSIVVITPHAHPNRLGRSSSWIENSHISKVKANGAYPKNATSEKTMTEREQLIQLISRTMPTVPSLMADAILKSKWLKDHDAHIGENNE